jgi:hypothetical protein
LRTPLCDYLIFSHRGIPHRISIGGNEMFDIVPLSAHVGRKFAASI